MNYKFVIPFLAAIFIYSCNSGEKTDETTIENLATDSIKQPEPIIQKNSDLEIFRNMEIVDYCVLLPLNEYAENYDENEKAGHTFVHKTKKNNEISVKGLLRANTEVSVENYFANSLEEAELEGKIIEKKELIKTKNCFYSKGYWNNSIYELRFIEVCWLRKDDVVKYYSSFDIADTAIWNNRLESILQIDSYCK